MIRHLSATGITSAGYVQLHPNVGYRWKILSVQLFLKTGSASGSRQVAINYSPYQTLAGDAILLCGIGSQTGTDSDYFTNLFGSSGGTYIKYSDIYCDASTNITTVPSLQTGDSYGYDIQVLEEPDI